jgi:pimeloyl-ACP methyl ester carboxylesterase
MAVLERNGMRLHYEVRGRGPAILFTHGFAASSAMWAGDLERLADRFTVIAWDLPGHAGSDSPEDPARYAEAEVLADMIALLDACDAREAVIAGHSLGGYLSLAFQQLCPARTRALALIATGPGYRDDEARAGWNRFAVRQAEKYETRGLAALPTAAEIPSAGHRSATGLALAARGLLAQVDAHVIDGLSAVSAPTLILVGSRDERYFAAADYMAKRIPDARKALIEDAGHAPNLDQPDRFHQTLGAFLDGL